MNIALTLPFLLFVGLLVGLLLTSSTVSFTDDGSSIAAVLSPVVSDSSAVSIASSPLGMGVVSLALTFSSSSDSDSEPLDAVDDSMMVLVLDAADFFAGAFLCNYLNLLYKFFISAAFINL